MLYSCPYPWSALLVVDKRHYVEVGYRNQEIMEVRTPGSPISQKLVNCSFDIEPRICRGECSTGLLYEEPHCRGCAGVGKSSGRNVRL
jgi:hypothetical protein